ncbi:MAG: ABC transporter substrate-binding protein, partial [Pseudonocardia sp.]
IYERTAGSDDGVQGGGERMVHGRRRGDVSRRRFLRGAGAGLVLATGAGWIAACGGGAGETAQTGPPRPGGTLRVGMVGGGQVETLNVSHYTSDISITRQRQLFDSLVVLDPDLKNPQPALAEELVPNAAFTSWTIRLRRGVTFHNDKELTADDVLYTIRGWADQGSDAYSQIGRFVDLGSLRKRDEYTVELPFTIRLAEIYGALVSPPCMVYQDGEKDFTNPAGTGPFKLAEFIPGRSSTMVRNENYWESGRPYVDGLEILSFNDATAAFNALQSGETDLMPRIPYTQARVLEKGAGLLKLMVTEAPASTIMTMAVDMPPFDDVRVRQAMKCIVDREQMVNTVFLGFGTIGNDLAGPGLPRYAGSIPQRTQDIAKARQLLKEAGQEGLTVTLHTNSASPGLVEAAQLFAEQAKAAGVTVNIQQENPSAYYDPSQLYLKMPFYQETNSPLPALSSNYLLALASDGPFNGTHWKDPQTDELLYQALGSSGAEADATWERIQNRQWEEGGYIMWGQADFLDAMAMKVNGLVPNKLANAGNWTFKDVWLAS